MHRLTFILCVLIAISCSSTKKLQEKGTTVKLPLSMVEITDQLYADNTEIPNSAYKEYLYNIKAVYGIESTEYLEALPDVSVWFYQEYADSLHLKYLYGNQFNNNPVVGVTLNQAKKYAEWRTERVAEMILISKGLIKPAPNPTIENQFTIAKYLKGQYHATNKLTTSLTYPKFSIPTAEEWDTISGLYSKFPIGIDSLDKYNQKLLKDKIPFIHSKENLDFLMAQYKVDPKILAPPVRNKFGAKNIYGLYNTLGNVAELVDQNGVTKGGSWRDSLEELTLKKSVKRNTPNCYTGFRCIARMKTAYPIIN